ncbi:TPA: hypothetical protein ACG87Y_002814, partial [Enterococcus faecium]
QSTLRRFSKFRHYRRLKILRNAHRAKGGTPLESPPFHIVTQAKIIGLESGTATQKGTSKCRLE